MAVARALWNRRIKASDGTELAADVLLPAGDGPFPAVVVRTPYMRSRPVSNPKSWIRLVDYGYVLVCVDMRGRNDSGGEWVPWTKDPHDAHDVIEWIARQPWCTGKVGSVGGSYEALTQWWAVTDRPKHLCCMVPLCVGGVHHQRPFGTGIPMQYWLWWMNLVAGRTHQFTGAPSWEAWMTHAPLKSIDERLGLSRSAWKKYVAGKIEFFSDAAATLAAEDYAAIDIPVLVVVGWWDDQETMLAWQELQRAKSSNECRLLIGAWDHIGNTAPRPVLGGVDVSASVMDTVSYIEQFLARHLKSESTVVPRTSRCRIFCTGENRWEEMDHWPHPDARDQPLYLASDGDARGLSGNGRLTRQPDLSAVCDTYIYDPDDPDRDMSNLAEFAWSDPPLDHRYLQRRRDCLVYTSAPLEAPLKVSGRYRARLFVTSDRPDTDLYVRLSDVHPDGRAIGLIAINEPPAGLRLRYRDGPRPQSLVPGQVYEVTVDGSWLHHVFQAGHRLRLTINSGHFPLMARNAGTGGPWADDDVLHPQTNVIHHSPTLPSRIVLPIV